MHIQHTPKIRSACRIGVGANRPMIVELEDANDKKFVFQSMEKICGIKNERGKYFYVTNQLPDEIHEMKRMFLELKKENNNLQPSSCSLMKIKKGKFYTDGQEYKHVLQPLKLIGYTKLLVQENRRLNGPTYMKALCRSKGFLNSPGMLELL